MKQISSKLIDGKKYEVGHWALDKQLDIMVKLIKLLGEPIAMMIMGSMQQKGSLKEMLDSNLTAQMSSEAIKSLTGRLNEADVKNLLRECTDGLLCDGKQISYDVHFMGRIFHLLKVTLFCIRHQYQDFLDVIPDLKGAGLGADNNSSQQV